jgi:hypothetical protein
MAFLAIEKADWDALPPFQQEMLEELFLQVKLGVPAQYRNPAGDLYLVWSDVRQQPRDFENLGWQIENVESITAAALRAGFDYTVAEGEDAFARAVEENTVSPWVQGFGSLPDGWTPEG